MIWISNFNNFSLLENYGTPNFCKDLSTKILSNLFKNKFTSYIQDLEYTDISNIKNINIVILHVKKDFSSKFISNISSPFNNISLEFDIPEINKNYNYFHEVILHELTHLYEFYKITINNKKLPLYDKIKKGLINTINQDNIDPFNYFRYIVYLTLDNELNARVSQTFNHLKQTKSNDNQILFKSLKNSSSWKKMELINDFNAKKYTKDIIEILGLDFSCLLINIFNSELKSNGINYNINDVTNENDILNYFKIWKNIFNKKMKKHKIKLEKTILELC